MESMSDSVILCQGCCISVSSSKFFLNSCLEDLKYLYSRFGTKEHCKANWSLKTSAFFSKTDISLLSKMINGEIGVFWLFKNLFLIDQYGAVLGLSKLELNLSD